MQSKDRPAGGQATECCRMVGWPPPPLGPTELAGTTICLLIPPAIYFRVSLAGAWELQISSVTYTKKLIHFCLYLEA